MKIQEIVSLVEAKLNNLSGSYTLATSSGNIDEVIRLESEIMETEKTLQDLKKLL